MQLKRKKIEISINKQSNLIPKKFGESQRKVYTKPETILEISE